MIFFLNSTNRVYDDTELNKLPGILFSTGVFNTLKDANNDPASQALWRVGGDFLVEPAGGSMNVTAKPGSATVLVSSNQGSTTEQQRVVIQEDNELTASVAANATLPVRADAVVLRVDQSIITDDDLNASGSNAVSLVVISGNSANPLSDLEITVALGGDPFIRLADLLVPQNATEITGSMVTDRRTLAKMARSVKMGSDVFRFFAVTEDPAELEQGDVWYNSTEGILKMYDGTNTISLQTQDFDWGYYPPGGVDQNVENADPIVENTGTSGVGSVGVYKTIDLGDTPGSFTLMAGELFEMPNIENPYIRLKMGNPLYPAGIDVEVWSVDGSDDPDSKLETVLSLSAGNVPKNDYVSFYLDGNLYTPGTKYLLVIRSNQTGFINSGNDSDFLNGAVLYSSFEDEDGYLLGRMQGSVASLTDTASSCSWGSPTSNVHLVMSIAEREEYAFGETNATGNAFLLSQGFIPKSQDIIGFRVLKGASIGSPTSDITASLYRADESYQPTGDVITTATITATEWATGSSGAEKVFDVAYDQLIIGSKYVVVFDTTVHDNDNKPTMFFGTSQSGSAYIYNTSDGWTALNGNLFFGILTSAIKKIVVTDFQGLIDPALIPRVPKRVAYVESSTEPAFSIDTADVIVIELAHAVSNMSTNMIGTPSDFQELWFRITASGANRAITWGDMFESAGVALDTEVASGETLTAHFIYNAETGKFGCVLSVETS